MKKVAEPTVARLSVYLRVLVELLQGATVRLVPAVAHPSALALATEVIPAATEGGWAAVLDHVG